MFEEIKSQEHAALKGAEGRQVHYRPDRYAASQLDAFPRCDVVLSDLVEGTRSPVNVVNFSSNGIAIISSKKPTGLSPGKTYDCDITLTDQLNFKKTVQVARSEDTPEGTLIGVRFRDSLLDIEDLFKKSRESSYLRQMMDLSRRVGGIVNNNGSNNFKTVVSDMKFYLETIRDEIDKIENEACAEKVLQSKEAKESFLANFYEEFGPIFQKLIVGLNNSVKEVSEEESKHHAIYVKECLGDLFFTSPLWERAYKKPFGYSGDFVIMEISYWDHYRGETLFGKLLTKAGIMMSAPTATRTRADLVKSYIKKTVDEAPEGPINILSIACGPAKEVKEYLKESYPAGKKINISLLDQDKRALDFCHKDFAEFYCGEGDVSDTVKLKFINASIRSLLKDDEFVLSLGEMDLIYTVGLFDYLPLPVSQRLAQRLFSLLKPHGRLIIGNLRENCTSKGIFDLALDWPMFYRTEEELLQFIQSPSSIAPEQPFEARVEAEKTGVNLFLNVRRHSNSLPPKKTEKKSLNISSLALEGERVVYA